MYHTEIYRKAALFAIYYWVMWYLLVNSINCVNFISLYFNTVIGNACAGRCMFGYNYTALIVLVFQYFALNGCFCVHAIWGLIKTQESLKARKTWLFVYKYWFIMILVSRYVASIYTAYLPYIFNTTI